MWDRTEEQINKAKKADACFITVTRREGDKLYHYQTHSFGFYFKDLGPSLKEIRKLLIKEYPGLKYVS